MFCDKIKLAGEDKENIPRRSPYLLSNLLTAESNFNQSENDKNLHDKTYYWYLSPPIGRNEKRTIIVNQRTGRDLRPVFFISHSIIYTKVTNSNHLARRKEESFYSFLKSLYISSSMLLNVFPPTVYYNWRL